MPAKIDRIGRAHEWLTSSRINQAVGNSIGAKRDAVEAAGYLAVLPEPDRRRVEVAAEKTAEWIVGANRSMTISESEVIGEASKKTGGPDFDIRVTFPERKFIGYSLKIQSGPSGVNLRNPTLDSILFSLCGRKFRNVLLTLAQVGY